MLIQRLRDYAVSHLSEALADPAFEPQPVHRLIIIDQDGQFLGFQETNGGTRKMGKKEYPLPKTFNVPKSPNARSSATESFPLLAVDSFAYVFGPGLWTKEGQEQKEQRHHKTFVKLLADAHQSSKDSALLSCVKFYENPLGWQRALNALNEMKKPPLTERFAFQMTADPQPVFQKTVAKAFWRERFEKSKKDGGSEQKELTRCLCCAGVALIAVTHDKIKGIPGGQPSGVSLVSFDKDAFTSFGWDKGDNSAICRGCADAHAEMRGVFAERNMYARDIV